MKKCPICGALNSEKADVCGVCSTSLADVSARSNIVSATGYPPIMSVYSLERTDGADRHKQGVLGLLFGIGMVATGILMLEIIGLVGFLLLLFGFTVIATDLSWMRGNKFYELNEPILHGRAPMHGYLHYPTRDEKEEKTDTEPPLDSSSGNTDDNQSRFCKEATILLPQARLTGVG